jgi:hypothetical protein
VDVAPALLLHNKTSGGVMDVSWFFQQRVAFIRQLYAGACAPHVERQRKIEAGEPPFDEPPFFDDGEPPFLEEFLEARDSADVLGHACLCMLSSALQAYLHTCDVLYRTSRGLDEEVRKKLFRKKGWVHGYDTIFTNEPGVRFSDGPVPVPFLEEIVLTRNAIQHQLAVTSNRPNHPEHKGRRARPLFANEDELRTLSHFDTDPKSWLMPPTVHVDAEKLTAALDAATWFDEALMAKVPPSA